MSVLYDFTCDTCGHVEAFAPVGARWGTCPECGGEARRRFSVPVTDCASFGKNTFYTRTLPTARKAQDAQQEERIRDLRRRDHTHQQFGAGKTTGS